MVCQYGVVVVLVCNNFVSHHLWSDVCKNKSFTLLDNWTSIIVWLWKSFVWKCLLYRHQQFWRTMVFFTKNLCGYLFECHWFFQWHFNGRSFCHILFLMGGSCAVLVAKICQTESVNMSENWTRKIVGAGLWESIFYRKRYNHGFDHTLF